MGFKVNIFQVLALFQHTNSGPDGLQSLWRCRQSVVPNVGPKAFTSRPDPEFISHRCIDHLQVWWVQLGEKWWKIWWKMNLHLHHLASPLVPQLLRPGCGLSDWQGQVHNNGSAAALLIWQGRTRGNHALNCQKKLWTKIRFQHPRKRGRKCENKNYSKASWKQPFQKIENNIQ